MVGRRVNRGGKASKKAERAGYGGAGSSNGHSGQEEENADDDGDEMDIDPPLYPNVIEDSDIEDSTFIGKSSDIEMGDGDGDEEDEDEDGDPVRRTRRTRRPTSRYTDE